MKNLKIYYIDESYINYLRQFDKNVAYNKNTTRPYIGIVYTYNNYNYFAPLSSPKPKHININPKAIDIYKIKDGELGVVNINNMIPTPIEELTEVLPTITDPKYKKMLEEQLTFLNNKPKDERPEPEYDGYEPAETEQNVKENDPFADFGESVEISDDDLPF